jgi:hypothetical protein
MPKVFNNPPKVSVSVVLLYLFVAGVIIGTQAVYLFSLIPE